MGALAGIIEAQYGTLRSHGHSPSEAFNETVEELTQSLIRLVDENGMDWMYNNCSETARIGALRWKERFREATQPVFDSLYDLVAAGEETRIVLEKSKEANYKQKLADELKAMGNSELWRAGATVRSLRPASKRNHNFLFWAMAHLIFLFYFNDSSSKAYLEPIRGSMLKPIEGRSLMAIFQAINMLKRPAKELF